MTAHAHIKPSRVVIDHENGDREYDGTNPKKAAARKASPGVLALALLVVAAIWSVSLAEPATVIVGGRVYQGELAEVPATQPATQPVAAVPAVEPGDVVAIDLPATQPATVRGATGVLKTIRLNGKPLRGSFEITDALIDANGQSRVIEPSAGARQVLRNVKIVNVGRSVIERSVIFSAGDKPAEILFDRVTTADTPGYTIYLDASWKDGKATADGAMVHVTLTRCDLGSSLYETVVRLMPGVAGTIEDSRIWDRVDLGADGRPTSPPNKAHSALRGHGYSIDVARSDVQGYAKFGFGKSPSKSVRLVEVKFIGGVEFEGALERSVDRSTLNGKPYR